MKNLFGRRYLGRAVLLFCLTASIALADVVDLTLTGLSGSYGGEYTSPYTFSVDGSQTKLLLACLDLNRRVGWDSRTYQVYYNEGPDWPGRPLPPGGSTPQMYAEAAILTKWMLSTAPAPYPNGPNRSQGMYAWAIWKIFSTNIVLPTADASTINGYITDAAAAYGRGEIPSYRVYEPLTGSAPNYDGQRFIGVPDGGVTLMLLGGVLIGLETLRRRLRA